VDGLHQRAGSRAVIDLHGRLDEVICLGAAIGALAHPFRPRSQHRTRDGMPRPCRHRMAMPTSTPSLLNRSSHLAASAAAACSNRMSSSSARTCRPHATKRARDALAGADALLVAGSSLMVYSGFRFVQQAHGAGLPIAIINRGRTRGDEYAGLESGSGGRRAA
jgi:NAD-dependent SIR2 family protein deacetylase